MAIRASYWPWSRRGRKACWLLLYQHQNGLCFLKLPSKGDRPKGERGDQGLQPPRDWRLRGIRGCRRRQSPGLLAREGCTTGGYLLPWCSSHLRVLWRRGTQPYSRCQSSIEEYFPARFRGVHSNLAAGTTKLVRSHRHYNVLRFGIRKHFWNDANWEGIGI